MNSKNNRVHGEHHFFGKPYVVASCLSIVVVVNAYRFNTWYCITCRLVLYNNCSKDVAERPRASCTFASLRFMASFVTSESKQLTETTAASAAAAGVGQYACDAVADASVHATLGEVPLRLVTLNGSELHLKLTAPVRIAELQVIAKHAFGIPRHQQRLFVGAREVHPLESLSDALRDHHGDLLVITLVRRPAACDACGAQQELALQKLKLCSGCLEVA